MSRRLSELLGTHVLDADGNDLGEIHDVVAVQDGPVELPFGALFRVETLRVGGWGFASRLSYAGDEMKGPWPLAAFFRWMTRHGVHVPWDMVESWEDDVVRLKPEWSRPATRR